MSDPRKQVEKILGEPILDWQPGSGNQPSFIAKTEDHSYFIKTSKKNNDSLVTEAQGLKELKKFYANIPKLHFSDEDFLVIDYIKRQEPTPEYWKQLAENLSAMHRHSHSSFGYTQDNWIGLSEQKNQTSEPAAGNAGLFFWENRIAFKLSQVKDKYGKLIDNETEKRLQEKVVEKLNHKDVYPSPCHGDLWGGNIVCGQGSQAYLIDPAFYFGDRESDLAMTECFGGFSPIFYKAYNEIFPLSEGYEERKHIFNLYHMLNHYIIFGNTYKRVSEDIIQKIIG